MIISGIGRSRGRSRGWRRGWRRGRGRHRDGLLHCRFDRLLDPHGTRRRRTRGASISIITKPPDEQSDKQHDEQSHNEAHQEWPRQSCASPPPRVVPSPLHSVLHPSVGAALLFITDSSAAAVMVCEGPHGERHPARRLVVQRAPLVVTRRTLALLDMPRARPVTRAIVIEIDPLHGIRSARKSPESPQG